MPKTIKHKTLLLDTLKGNISLDSLKKSIGDDYGVIPDSISMENKRLFMLAEPEKEPSLIVVSLDSDTLTGFTGEPMRVDGCADIFYSVFCPLDHSNALHLRETLPRTAPSVLDCMESFGTGDRIGGISPATPGHITALDDTGFSTAVCPRES